MVRSIFQWNSAWTALTLLCCLFFTHPFCKASGSQCFTREGNLVDNDHPCNPTQSESFCCHTGWACLPNRLCASTASNGRGISFGRGSCSDKLWASTSQCPSFCLDNPYSRNKGTPVIQCDDPNTYCCGYNTCNCTTGFGTISISGGIEPFTTIGVMQSSTLDVSSQSIVTMWATGSAKETERTTETVTEKVSPTESPSISSLSSTGTALTSTEPSSTNALSIANLPSNLASKTSQESKEGTKISIAVSVSLGVLSIASIATFAFWRERRLKIHMEELRSRWVPVETYLNQRGVLTAVQPSSMNPNRDAILAPQPVRLHDQDRR